MAHGHIGLGKVAPIHGWTGPDGLISCTGIHEATTIERDRGGSDAARTTPEALSHANDSHWQMRMIRSPWPKCDRLKTYSWAPRKIAY